MAGDIILMIFDWKIIVTVIVVLIVLASLAGTTPTVGNFFGDIKEKIFGIIERNSVSEVDFSLSWQNYDQLKIDAKNPVNIKIGRASCRERV